MASWLRQLGEMMTGVRDLSRRLGPLRVAVIVVVFLLIAIGCRQVQQQVAAPPVAGTAPAGTIIPPEGSPENAVPWKQLAGLARPAKITGTSESGVHPPQFILAHAKVARDDKKSCAQCHEPKYCSSCHAAYTTHPLNWLLKHGEVKKKGILQCEQCHPQRACQRCHTEGRPPTHDNRWLQTHGLAAELQTSCWECHTHKGCQTCHKKLRPADHKASNWRRIHGSEAKGLWGRCYACHGREGCGSCHGGVIMPHDADWLQTHGGEAASRQGKACQQCHPRDMCSTCHQRSMPQSHLQNWTPKHGAASRRSDARCSMCHRQSTCTNCHGLPMPHPAQWGKAAHSSAAVAEPGKCAQCHEAGDCLKCHQKKAPSWHGQKGFAKQHASARYDRALCDLCHGKQSCTSCHQGLTMPHPDDFVAGKHGPMAASRPQVCAQCHKDTKVCQSCHEAMPPASHQTKSFAQKHGDRVDPKYCALCHGANSCTTCHSQLKKSPHPDDWAMTHKRVASFDRKAKCFLCHKIDFCQSCHEDARLK